MTLLRQNPLTYPAGFRPGFDPSHVAAKNCLLSAVPGGGNYNNLLNGTNAVVSGSGISPSIVGKIGPAALQSSQANTGLITFAGSAGTQPFTMAGIFSLQSLNGALTSFLLGQGSGFNNCLSAEAVTTGAFSYFIGGSSFDTGVQVVAGASYFFAISATATVSNWIICRLDTGAIFSGTQGSGTLSAGNFYVLNRSDGARAANVWGGPVAVSNVFLGQTQLLKFAEDPWAFWYPNKTINLASAAAAAPPTGMNFTNLMLMGVG